MAYTQNEILIKLCILLAFILLIKLIFSKSDINSIEPFADAVDLLTKFKSNDINTINTDTSSETSIFSWSTMLQNVQDNNKIKTIGLYKPNLVINGIVYSKLGDMLSLNTDFSPPSKTDFTLLLSRNSSDIKSPIEYNLVVSFGTDTLPSYYSELQDKINNTNIAAILPSINNCMNYNISLQTIVNKKKNIIITRLTQLITSNTQLKINNQTQNLSTILTTLNNNTNNENLEFSINNNTQIQLPVGLDVSILSGDTKYNILWNNNININNISLNSNKKFNLKQNNNFSKIPKLNKYTYATIENCNIFQYIQNDIILYLQNLCKDIINIYSNTTNNKLLEYLKLTTSITDVKALLQILVDIDTVTLDTKQDETDMYETTDTPNIQFSNTDLYIKLNPYKNTNTFLGNIINLILDNNNNYYYQYITFSPYQLVFSSSSITYNKNNNNGVITDYNNTIASAIKLIINNSINNINSFFNNINCNINDLTLNTSIVRDFKPHLNNILQFQNNITDGKGVVDFFPLQIYAPIAPPNYISLGHIFCNTKNDLNKVKTSDNVACIPQHCVREVREWAATDKVFEYNKNNIYWALYKNPYIGTFIAVNKSQLPLGKVYKVVACVAKCTAIEDLTKADNCARKYQQINNSIMSKVSKTPDLVGDAEDNIYLEKIKMQSDNIVRLTNRAQQMQISIDKATIVNEEMNKSKLQNYVDVQQRNIDLVVQKLENDNNTIKTNINAPVETLNNLINIVNSQDTLSNTEKINIINKIIYNATNLSKNIISKSQYNNNVNQILKSCPQYDMNGLVKKDLVADVCYGCGTPN